jgi:hypothetical protein
MEEMKAYGPAFAADDPTEITLDQYHTFAEVRATFRSAHLQLFF